MRRLPGPGAPGLGPPPRLPGVRPRGLLRQLAGKARHPPLPFDRPPGHPLLRAGRGLVLVLRGRVSLRARRSSSRAVAPMNGQPPPDALFDYDARPVTPQIVLVGTSASPAAYAIRDFLSRNGCFYDWIDLDQSGSAQTVVGVNEIDTSLLPLCILPNGSRLAPATVEQVAAGLGMVAAPARSEYDLAIVGAGPAGLGAAVNAASEGLRTVVVEAVAPGGQAGTTSMIENYLGFPNGISGSELATRAVVQARRFGAELLLARPLVGVSADGPGYVAGLSDGTLIRGRAVLFASGVEWRRLDVPGIDDLLGAGVYYGAGPSEAPACTDSQVVVVGGGNSAGQAVVRFSRYAQQVTLLVRGPDLGAAMSQYLIDQVSVSSAAAGSRGQASPARRAGAVTVTGRMPARGASRRAA